jgi:flagellar L-ring protein FlgH
MKHLVFLSVVLVGGGCARLAEVGRGPEFTPTMDSYEHHAVYAGDIPLTADPGAVAPAASLWATRDGAMFDDRRAAQRGDILTVIIDIDDSASFSSNSDRNRSGSESMGIPSLLGIPQRIDRRLPEGASLAEAVATDSASSFTGTGSTAREEELMLRVAATVVEVLPNGTLLLDGRQEVRLNNELRQLLVSGFVRPEDVSRTNEVRYDRMAGARISYGGRGLVSDVQAPRYGQQAADILLPF